MIGIVLLDERLSRPGWHILVAVIGLSLALVGAREGTREDMSGADSPDRSVATA